MNEMGEFEDKQFFLLQNVTENINDPLNINESCETILNTLLDTIPAEGGMILVKENRSLRVVTQKGFGRAEPRTLFNIEQIIHADINDLTTSYIDDINNNDLFPFPLVKKNNIQSLLYSPAYLHNELVALVLLAWKGSHEKSREEKSLIKSAAQLLSMSFLNSKIYKRSEETQKELELRFNRMPIAFIVWDTDFRVESWNPAAEKIFGYSEEEAKDKRAYELIVPQDVQPTTDKVWENLLQGNMNAHSENKNITKDGHTIICEWTNTPLKDNEDKVIGVISMAQDITELQHTKTALNDKISELSKKNRYELATKNIVQTIHKTTDPVEVMENAVEVISNTVDSVDNISIYLVEGNNAVMKANRGYPDWFVEEVGRIPYPKGFTWRTIIDRKPRYVNDVRKDKAIGPAGRKVGTRSYASLPISYEGDVIGVININSYIKNAFMDDEITLLESVAHHVETAINNAKKVDIIRRNEERFISFMNHLPGGAFIKDLDGNYIYTNNKYPQFFNVKEDIIGKTDRDIFNSKVSKQIIEDDKKVWKENRPTERIQRIPTKDNDLHYYFVCKFPISDSSYTPNFLGGVVIDVTDMQKAKQKLQEQAALLDIANDAIFMRDLDDNILYWNKAAENLYGWKESEVIGKKAASDLFKNQKNFEDIFEIVKNEGSWTGEITETTKEGKELVVISSWTLVKDPDENPKSIFVVNKDITENKKMQKILLQSQRLESIGTLAGGIAHDLNNALLPAMMSIQMLKDYVNKEDEKYHTWVNMIEESTQRASDLVNQVLSFSRGVEGEYEAVQVKVLIKELLKLVQQTIPKSINIEYELSDDMWDILGNVSQVHQILMNLCLNARDAMSEEGTLKITGENIYIDEQYAKFSPDAKVGHYVLLSVSDTGIGIPKDHIDKIFDPFFTTKEYGKGTGLGLSTVFKITKDHGGFLYVYSEVDEGTVFKIYLPAIKDSQTVEVKRKELERAPKGEGETILVVDDESTVRDITKLTLENNGYNALTASDGTDAIAVYTENINDIDVVIMDTMMPNMDGPTTIAVLYRINPDIKIISSSGLRDSQKPLDKINVKVHAYLTKPYTSEALLKTIRKVLEED